MRVLKKHLFDAYGGFADKRIKNLDKSSLFIVDDRTTGDEDARGQLYLWFCTIHVRVVAHASVSVEMRGTIPTSSAISSWIAANSEIATASDCVLAIHVPISDTAQLINLAGIIEDIPNGRYSEKSYKHTCPRTARSLRKLGDVLSSCPQTEGDDGSVLEMFS
jgi:hypothetical protein